MRTARLLPVSPSMHCSWEGVYLVPWGGVYLVPGGGGVPGSRGRGMYLVLGGCTWSGGGGVPGPRRRGVYLVSWGVYLVPGGGGVPSPGGGVPAQVLSPWTE